MASMEEMEAKLDALPDISFIGEDTLESIQAQMVDDYQTRYEELTGKTQALARADPVTLILYACSVQIYQMAIYLDTGAKQSLLKYAFGEYLDQLAALKGITRHEASKAQAVVAFTLSEAQDEPVSIPEGTLVSAGDDGDVYFETTEYAEVPAGQTYIELTMTCTEAGEVGNDILPGALSTIVDPIAYLDSVENIETTSGGSDIETDDELRYRIFEAPFRWSVAGPEEAYRYWAGEYNEDISDIYVGSVSPGEVLIEFLMEDGDLPDAGTIKGLQSYLDTEELRPLTDKVVVKSPDVVSYTINLTYYINKSQSASASSIQEAVNDAVNFYRLWQGARIGRDINPSELIRQVVVAGAKRVEVTSPASFQALPETSVAKCDAANVTVKYGGLEDD